MEQFTEPVEGQKDAQEAAADRPSPIKAGRSRLVVQRLGSASSRLLLTVAQKRKSSVETCV